MITKYKGQHGGKKGQKIRQGFPLPLFGQCPKENILFTEWLPLGLRLNIQDLFKIVAFKDDLF